MVAKNNIFEEYLQQKNVRLNQSIYDEIEDKRIAAIQINNEEEANYYWCLRQIYSIQNGYLSAFQSLTTAQFKDAWLLFDTADIELGFIERNFAFDAKQDKYHLTFIGHMIKEYQKLFPYHFFSSRETIIKEEKCSICGQKISLRQSCNHISGKLYMGELCSHQITDLEFKAIAIVTDPFDKYALLTIEGKEYNYGMLEYLLTLIHSPYQKFHVEIRKEKLPEFLHIGRNDLCPCESGKKYKNCHLGSPDELVDHHIIYLPNKEAKTSEIRTFNTWK